MLRKKPLELPPAVARAFVRDMHSYFKAEGHKRDEIAARQRSALSEYLGKRDKKLRVTERDKDVQRNEGPKLTNMTCARL